MSDLCICSAWIPTPNSAIALGFSNTPNSTAFSPNYHGGAKYVQKHAFWRRKSQSLRNKRTRYKGASISLRQCRQEVFICIMHCSNSNAFPDISTVAET